MNQETPSDVPAIDLSRAVEERYLAYALSVVTSRALPDVRDGLKPVQRRILYAMFQNLRLTAGARPRKSAAVVGEVLGKYHPHGDLAAYEAMVRMAQPFAMRYPLVHGEGNFGSLDGDSPAAMRYTEARLTPIAEELLRDVREETVDFRDNYDSTLREPVVLPAAVPQLLINGSTGIAVGMATNIPPHNLKEVIEALVALVRDPTLESKDLCRFIKGPDFPTGGEILNTRAELRQIYETGQGPIRLRGQFVTETSGRRRRIIITSVPYTTNKAKIVEEIAEHIASRKLPLATDVRDESTDQVRIVVELKGDASPEAVMAYLFKHTDLQVTYHANFTALIPTATPGIGQPQRLGLKELCQHFLDFRFQVVTRRLEHELRQLQARLHILAGFLKIFRDLDRAIEIIRAATSREHARDELMRVFRLDAGQANAILDTRLYQLSKLEVSRIREEQKEKAARAEEIAQLLARPQARWKIVEEELLDVARRYGDARRTQLRAGAELVYDAQAYVVHEDAVVVITRDGWLKRLGELKEPSSTRVREGDQVHWVLRGTTKDHLVLFSNRGIVYVMKVIQVPATTGYGEPVQSLLNFGDGERIVAATLLAGKNGDEASSPQSTWLAVSAGGLGARVRPDLSETTKNGRRYARPKDGDEVAVVSPAEGEVCTIVTAGGYVLSFPTTELPELSGAGRGVWAIRAAPGDRVVGALCHAAENPPVALDENGETRRLQAPAELAHRGQRGRPTLKRFKPVALVPRDESRNGLPLDRRVIAQDGKSRPNKL
ncbi:MAG: DNA topoisomerase (ATP-hydrolyzing) [Candidatus Binatia bacterium]|nr:MAG: DNA topoisomerase (ATP-hydrolyzing) [Candidatus Binatia bacterium]